LISSFTLIYTRLILPPPSFPTRRSSDLVKQDIGKFNALFLVISYFYFAYIGVLRGKGGKGHLDLIVEKLPSSEPFSFPNPFTEEDRKSTRLNSSHVSISYAVFCL